MFLDGCAVTVVSFLLSQFRFVNHTQPRNNGASVKNLFKFFFDKSFVEFLSPFGKFFAGIGIILIGNRSCHVTFSLAVPVEGVVQTSVLTILRAYIIDHPVGIAILQGKLLGGIIVRIHHEFHHHIRIIAQEGTLFDGHPYRKTAGLVLLLITEGCDIFIENILQLLGLCVVINHLALNELRHFHLFLTVESERVWCAQLALLAADDIVIAKELHNFLHLILDGQTGRFHIVYQK